MHIHSLVILLKDQYFTDDANRGVSHKQCVATPDELMATFTYKMG